MNDKINLNFSNPFEKNPLPKSNFFNEKKTIVSDTSILKNKNLKFKTKFSSLNKSLPTKNTSMKALNYKIPKLNYKKIGGESEKRIRQQVGLKPYGDFDKDGVANILDCWPRDPLRQGPQHTIQNVLTDPRLTEAEKQSILLSNEEQLMQQQMEQPQQTVPVQNVQPQNNTSKVKQFFGSLVEATGVPEKLQERRENEELKRELKRQALLKIKSDIQSGKDNPITKQIVEQETRKILGNDRQTSAPTRLVQSSTTALRQTASGFREGVGSSGFGNVYNPGAIIGGRLAQPSYPQPQYQQPSTPGQYQQPINRTAPQPVSQPQGGTLKEQISNAKKPIFGPVAPDGRKWSERSKKYVTYERGNYQDYTRPSSYGGQY
jgi:hypothetical protein